MLLPPSSNKGNAPRGWGQRCHQAHFPRGLLFKVHCIFVPLGVPSHAWLHGFDKYNVMYLSPESLHFRDLNPQGSRIRHSSLKLCLAFHVA